MNRVNTFTSSPSRIERGTGSFLKEGKSWRRARMGWLYTGLSLVLLIWFWLSLPNPLFDTPTSAVIEDRAGQLLSARIASDEQWRFPLNPVVPEKFEQAILQFEDKRFYYHPGVDPLALGRAIYQNTREQRVVSGASTITMQVIRLSRKGPSRTMVDKLVESILAVRLELSYSKAEILALYAAHAPFGGNVVGLEAASWRYFGRQADQLSWAEMATLAVLPNNPSLVHPGKNRDVLLARRNWLLQKMKKSGVLDSWTAKLAMAEDLPLAPRLLPNVAPHLLDRTLLDTQKNPAKNKANLQVRTTINGHVQRRAIQIVNQHGEILATNGIHNAAALIIENSTGEVAAYVGNTKGAFSQEHGHAVDIIAARRSPGSTLKPFLYAAMMEDGRILPQTLVADIPTRYGGFAPVNYNQRFEGALPADEALARSLNVPAVRLLRDYGVARFHDLLDDLGMSTLTNAPSHYGLSLILGGAEVTMWDMAGMYAGLARTLMETENQEIPLPNIYQKGKESDENNQRLTQHNRLSAASIWLTFEAMAEVKRPEAEGLWEYFSSSRKIAWKTGTSYGFRDAWAIGVTPQYTVVVWAGNADGEGRPGLTGVAAAAPIMFDLFDMLDIDDVWFPQPLHDMHQIEVCSHSGHRATPKCKSTHLIWVAEPGLRTEACPYHVKLHLDKRERWQVHGACESPAQMVHISWFVLPPAMEWFYKQKQGSYRTMPDFRADCRLRAEANARNKMEFIYPKDEMTIWVPTELDGNPGRVILEVAHRTPQSNIHWHLDGTYLGSTRHFHQMAVRPSAGDHKLVLVDEAGERQETRFSVEGAR